MKSNLVCAALACVALVLSSTAALAAQGDPIPSIPVGLDHDPGGQRVALGVTDGDGEVTFGKLPPGNYMIVVDGPSLVRAMDRLVPPARHTSEPSVSLGVGGLFGGGGSHHSNNGGAGPVGGSNGGSHSNGGNSTGGVGLGMNVPLGGNGNSGSGGSQAPTVNVTLTVTVPPGAVIEKPSGLSQETYSGTVFISETPYCRDVAGQGMRIGFTVPENASSKPQDVTFVVTAVNAVGESD